jgi:hypothetical protein
LEKELKLLRDRYTDITETTKGNVQDLKSELNSLRNELTFERSGVSDPELREFLEVKFRREQETYEDAAATLEEFIRDYKKRDGNLLSKVTGGSGAGSAHDRQTDHQRGRPRDVTHTGRRASDVTQGDPDLRALGQMSSEEYAREKERLLADLFKAN